jgi:hypothetical protein
MCKRQNRTNTNKSTRRPFKKKKKGTQHKPVGKATDGSTIANPTT